MMFRKPMSSADLTGAGRTLRISIDRSRIVGLCMTFRRLICGIPTNSLNKTFANLYKEVERSDYLDSPNGACRDITGMGKWGNGDVDITVNPTSNLDYIMTLIRQSFEKHSEEIESIST